MPLQQKIENGFECAAGLCRQGPYLCALTRDARRKGFLEPSSFEKYHLAPGVSQEQWYQALDELTPRGLVLALPDGAQEDLESQPQRLIGPACPSATVPEPVVAWARKVGDQWEIRLLQAGRTRTVMTTPTVPSRLSVESHQGACYLAFQQASRQGCTSLVVDAEGKTLLECGLRYPGLFSTGPKLYLLAERTGADRIAPELLDVLDQTDPVRLQAPLPYAYKGRLAWDEANAGLYLAAELSDRWGHFELIGICRELGLWKLSSDATRWIPAEATANGLLPSLHRSFAGQTGGWWTKPRYIQCPPITPMPWIFNSQPAVAYRQFAPRGNKEFGWDVMAIFRRGWGWSEPVRLNERLTTCDTPYFVRESQGALEVTATAFDQRPIRTFEEEATGRREVFVPQPIENPAAEVHRLRLEDLPGPREIPPSRIGLQIRPPSWEAIAPAPPKLESAPMTLLWSDIHNHTVYSKCMASMDGSPEEMVRFQRDVLGCKVLTFTDHLHLMDQRETAYHWDMLDAEAGDECVVLYGCEPGTFPDHHTNFYSIDRDIADRLWRIVYRFHSRNEIYRRIRKELPHRSVAVMRHFHGWNWQGGDPQSDLIGRDWAPDLEIAAEAMQNRGCALLNQTPNDKGLPAFPANFFNKGARMGLVAGSDHNGGQGILHYCITGIWAEKAEAQSVWEALWNRQTIAGQNGKVALWTTCNGKPMGSEVQAVDTVRIQAQASSARPLRRAALMVNGELGPWTDLEGTSARFELKTNYYGPDPAWACVAVEADGAYQDSSVLTFSTPHFLTLPQGDI